DAAGKFVRQDRIDGAMALDATEGRERLRDDADAKMRLSRAVERGMVPRFDVVVTRMQMAFVDHRQPFRGEGRLKLAFDRRLDGQGRLPSPYEERPRANTIPSRRRAMIPQMSILVSRGEAPIIPMLLRNRNA